MKRTEIDAFFAMAIMASCVLELVPDPLPALSRMAVAGVLGVGASLAVAWLRRRSA